MPPQPCLPLNDGSIIPQLGLGVMYVKPEDVPALMIDAVTAGYRHFDTATHYFNEAGVGEGLRRIELPRKEILTKVLGYSKKELEDIKGSGAITPPEKPTKAEAA